MEERYLECTTRPCPRVDRLVEHSMMLVYTIGKLVSDLPLDKQEEIYPEIIQLVNELDKIIGIGDRDVQSDSTSGRVEYH